MSRSESSIPLLTLYEAFYTAAEKSGLNRSTVHFDARRVPASAVSETFCIFIQSKNSNKYRDQTEIRMTHTIAVSMLFRAYPDEHRTIEEHTTGEERLMAALLNRSNLPDTPTRWVNTARSLVMNDEMLLVVMTFTADHDWDFSAVV